MKTNEELQCPMCAEKGKNVNVVKRLYLERLECPQCGAHAYNGSSIGEYIHEWKTNAEDVITQIRPLEQSEINYLTLYLPYKDCLDTLLIGRYSASIVLMGVFVEILVKERIRLKTGKYGKGELCAILKVVKKEKFMDRKDINLLNDFRKEIRNPYQHVNHEEILKEYKHDFGFFKSKDGEMNIEKLDQMKKLTDSREVSLTSMDSTVNPIIVFMKELKSKPEAIKLFNKLTDFLIEALVKYFNPKEPQLVKDQKYLEDITLNEI